MNKLEEIRKACIVANKEIVELKFGCEVLLGEFKGKIVSADFAPAIMVQMELGDLVTVKDDYKILGRPIRLADVLLAIDKFVVKTNENEAEAISVDERGNFARLTVFKNGGVDLKVLFTWNLRTDDLSQQSPETINFLYEIFK